MICIIVLSVYSFCHCSSISVFIHTYLLYLIFIGILNPNVK